MSDQWTADPGAYPPAPSAAPAGWRTQPGQLAPDGPPPFGAGPAMPAPPALPPRAPRTTRNLLIALSVLAVLLLVVSVSLVVVVRSDDDVVASGPTTTSTPRSTTSSTPPTTGSTPSTPPTTVDPTPSGPAPTPEELDAEIDELSAFVEQERGLSFKEPVEVTMADEVLFDERLFADFDDPDQVAARTESEHVLKAMGLIDAGLDLEATYRQLLSAGVLGFYDPETAELVVRGQAITPYTRQTLVHELTHALDDQHFEIFRPDYDLQDDETAFGFSAVLEGDARRVESEYVKAMSSEDRARRDLEEQQFGAAAQPIIEDLPVVLLKLLQAPYDHGQELVEQLLLVDPSLVDAAIDQPPSTSTQVLHADTYLAGIGALPVDEPVADGEIIDEGLYGELLTQYTLEDSEDQTVAVNAAAGWAGDWYVTWEDGPDNVCIRIAYAMDTDADLDELEDAYTSWAEPKGATVERDGDQLEVTSCSASASGTSPF